MYSKIKRLEELVNNSVVLIKKLEDENAVLKQQVQSLAAERHKAAKGSSGARELEQFKEKVRRKLSRITARIDKAVTLQDTLFGEELDDK